MRHIKFPLQISFLFAALLGGFLLLPGCSGGAGEFAAGAATGGVLTGTAMALQQQEEDLLARRAEALAQMEQAVTETEKLAAQAKVEALEKQIEKSQEAIIALRTAQAAISAAKVDWTDPEAVSNFSTAASVLIASYLLSRKSKK